MRTWTLDQKVDTIGLEKGSVLVPTYSNYPFDYQKCKGTYKDNGTYKNPGTKAKKTGVKKADLAMGFLVGILLIV